MVPDLIFQADFPSGAAYLLAEDALVFGNNLIERWRAGGGLLIWVRGAVRHEGSHYFMAHLSAEKQDEVMEMMSVPRNLSLLREFYAVMRSVASEYTAEYFSPEGNITRGYARIVKEAGRGYHSVRVKEFNYRGRTERVNFNLVVDEFLAFLSLVRGSDVRLEGEKNLRISGEAAKFYEKMDENTKRYLEDTGFTNLDVQLLWGRIEYYLKNPERLHEITKAIVIRPEDYLLTS